MPMEQILDEVAKNTCAADSLGARKAQNNAFRGFRWCCRERSRVALKHNNEATCVFANWQLLQLPSQSSKPLESVRLDELFDHPQQN